MFSRHGARQTKTEAAAVGMGGVGRQESNRTLLHPFLRTAKKRFDLWTHQRTRRLDESSGGKIQEEDINRFISSTFHSNSNISGLCFTSTLNFWKKSDWRNTVVAALRHSSAGMGKQDRDRWKRKRFTHNQKHHESF